MARSSRHRAPQDHQRARRRPRPPRRAPSSIALASPPGRRWSARAPQRSPKRRAGSGKRARPRGSALKSSRNESSRMRSPCSSGAAISSPLRNTPTTRPPDSQSAPRHRRPSVRNHQTSGSPEPSLLGPRRNARRRNTGCSRRSTISRRVNSSSSALVLEQAPVEPGDLVVLAPGVVVAVLRAAELVAAEQHRRALASRISVVEEVALLARAQRVDLGVVGLPLDAVVPASGCRPCRRGCPRGWPRCASRCRRRGRAA